MTRCWLPAGAIAGLLLWASQARALLTETQVLPVNIGELRYVITVTGTPIPGTKGMDDAIDYVVTLKPKYGKLPDCRVATLRLHDGASQVASCPVAESPFDFVLTYRFRVAAKYADKSKFDFADIPATPETNAEGKIFYRGFPGSDHYWFYLKDVPRLEAVTTAKAKGN